MTYELTAFFAGAGVGAIFMWAVAWYFFINPLAKAVDEWRDINGR